MSFINPIFLFATAAALLPVLYHLVRRMKARTVPFGSLMFLKATPRELIKKRRLRDRLLMAARSALFLLLALVFARPYLPAERLPFITQEDAASTVILVDRSFSMRYADRFERAVDAARSRIDARASGDEVALIAFDGASQIAAPLQTDVAAARAALDAMRPGYHTTDFFPALQQAQELLQDARHERRVVVLISDFQKAGWTGALENWKLEPGIEFTPVTVAEQHAENGYVEAFAISGRRSDGRYVARYDARIAMPGGSATNAGSGSGSLSAALVVDGAELDRRMLSSRASTSVSFQHTPPREGFHQGVLVLDEDDLADDDRYYFTEEVAGEPEVLVVDGPSGGAPRDGFYLRAAFDLGEASRFRFESDERLTNARLQEADLVFFANRAATPAERRSLSSFVEDGGTLILSAGDAADTGGFSALLEELGVGRVTQIVDARQEQGYEAIVGEYDVRHPIFAPFGGSGSVLQPKFRRYLRLEPATGTNVIARFDSGDPFLAERSVGTGRVLFFASTFNTSWTDMPLGEMYVPFVYQLAEFGTRRRDDRHMFTVGEPVEFAGNPGETWEIRAPGDRIYRVVVGDDGRGRFRETGVPGQYAAASGRMSRLFSVNVDPAESDLSARDAEEVYAAVVAPPQDEPRTPEQAAAAALTDDERKQKLWKWLLLIVIGLFAVESYFANRRSERGARTRSRAGGTRPMGGPKQTPAVSGRRTGAKEPAAP